MSEDNVRHLRRDGEGNVAVTAVTLEGEQVIMEVTFSPKDRPRTTYQYPFAKSVREDILHLFEKMGRILRDEE